MGVNNRHSFVGRRMILTDETEITKLNIAKVLGETYRIHQENAVVEQYLFDYERNIQPILDREKPIRPEINNRIPENNASKIVDVHLGYNVSNPVTFVRKSVIGKKEKSKDVDDAFVTYNRMMQSRHKAKLDVEMARNAMTCGLGYMMTLPARKKDDFAPFELMVPESTTTYVVYSNNVYREPKLAVTYFIHDDGKISFTAYTDEHFYKLDKGSGLGGFGEVAEYDNPLGVIPIVEFAMPDRMAVFEKAIPIMDAINIINSDRVNDIAQHVQSILWLNNCEIDSEQKKQLVDGDGVIMTRSTDGKEAKISYLSQVLDQAQVQSLVDYYQEQVLEITSTPSWGETTGGSTTGSVMLSNGWQYLEISAKTFEMMFDEPEHRLLDAVNAAIKLSKKKDIDAVRDIVSEDIEIKFNRNKTFDLISKTNALVSMINAGVDGLTAFQTVELFTDAQSAWAASKKTVEGLQKKLTSDNVQSGIRNPGTNNVVLNANAQTDERGFGGSNNKKKDETEKSMHSRSAAEVNS